MVYEMKRYQDWPERLARFVEARESTPFGWGKHDCVTMAADWMVLATGNDPIEDIRSWDDAMSAARAIEATGGLRAAAAERIGPEVSPLLAQRGDIVMHEETARPGLGVCLGESFAVPYEEGGVTLVSMARAVCAWRV